LLGSARTALGRLTLPVALATALVALLGAGTSSGASVDSLQSKVSAAKSEAQSLAAELQASKQEMFDAQARADAAQAREERLSGLLATGRAREARLSDRVSRSRRHLAAEKARLQRARNALAARLVSIYESGNPDEAEVALAGGSFSDLLVRSGYVSAIQQADDDLATRVEQVRNSVHSTVVLTTELPARARAYDAKLEAARGEIASARAAAQTEASNLAAISAQHSAEISGLQSKIDGWVDDIAAARAAAAKRAAANAADQAAAAAEVDRFFGGPYSIPTYIVMCESGGNYSAVNPSSGAGGAYQILPSTWELYGGTGAPQDGTKAEQDQIAAEIWADSGTSAWVCG
jgi:peptidoglycan hydrolase CwlO-like protein